MARPPVPSSDFGADLHALINGLGSPPVDIRYLTTQPHALSRRASWKLHLADGRVLKARRLESVERGAVLERLASLTERLPLSPVVARRGDALLEAWVPGPGVDTLPMDLDLAEALGSLLGTLAVTGDGSPLLEPRRRHLDGLCRKLLEALDALVAAGALSADTGDRLRNRALGNAPVRLAAGLVHLDFQPRNLVLGQEGPTLVDNEHLETGVLDLDLARTWWLWPMSAPVQTRFLRGYGRFRDPGSFLLHEVFWAIYTVARSAVYNSRIGSADSAACAALERLARGDLPRDWRAAPAAANAPAVKRVRLAFVCDYLAIGGQERICLNLLTGLDRTRFDPFVYAFRGGALAPAFRALGLPLLIGSDRDPLAAEVDWTPEDAAEKAVYRDTLAAALARDRIDAALVFAWRDAFPAAQRAGVSVLIEKMDGPGLLGKIADKSGFDRVVVESATLRNQLLAQRKELGLDEERVELVFPGIDLAHFNPLRFDRDVERKRLGLDPQALMVGTVGRLIRDKNIKVLIHALAWLRAQGCREPIRLLILGPDGGVRAELEALARDLEIDDWVDFRQAVEDVAPVLAALDVFAMVSLREGLPTAILEAMAMGLPIVTTGAGSIPEVIRDNGILVPGPGPEGLGRRLRDLLLDPARRLSMSRASRNLAARFALRHSIGRYEDLVLQCLAEKPPRQPE